MEQHVVQQTKSIDSLAIYNMYVCIHIIVQYKHRQTSFDQSI